MKLAGDKLFALIVIALVVGGLAIFASASLGLLARTGGEPWRLALTQVGFGLIPGVLVLLVLRFIKPQLLAKGIIPFYIFAICLTLSVFIPGVGATINGATRWIDLGITTIQPGEFLKIAVILMLSVYLAQMHKQLADPRKGLLGFGLIVGIPIAILLFQPNTSTALIIAGTSAMIYFLAGAPLRDFAIMGLIAIIGLGILVTQREYLVHRITTFINPTENPLSSGYQIQQSLIAIGSGGMAGRGFGQSVQKFNYLPEPVGDSVFAVYAEEFGFIGALILVLLFAAFAARGFMIAADAPNIFGMLAVTGLTLLLSLSAFMNMGAMLGVMPLTGLPLPFVSHGGTALLCALASVGIILNIAAHRTKKKLV